MITEAIDYIKELFSTSMAIFGGAGMLCVALIFIACLHDSESEKGNNKK